MDDPEDTEDTQDLDDLEIIRSTGRGLGIDEYLHSTARDLEVVQTASPESSTPEKHIDAPSTCREPERRTYTQGQKVEWSTDDSGDAYATLKTRKSTERKRAAAPRQHKKAATQDQVVGKRPRKDATHKRPTRGKDLRAESEDDMMEYTLPDYLQQRKARFDKRMEKLRESGLKLPPTYENIDFSDDERLVELTEKPIFPRLKPSAAYQDVQLPKSLGLIPASIAQWLRPYQVEGTAFLHQLFVYQTGGLLGDDMGLGKTVQVIAFLTAAFGKTGDERDKKRMRKMRRAGTAWYPRVLIICPGTLIENWKAELRRWGWWHVDTFHADTKEAAISAASSGRLEIMITTYTTYRLNKSEINMIEWDCVIADECHQIKGRRSETTQAMNEVNALCRIGLTGTAIQNSYDELWTLLNWTNPGKFGPITTWKTSISDPLKMGQSHDATVYELSKARKTAKALVENLLPQFFLRRMKSIIADQLPKKSDRVVFCPLTSTQSEAYENFLDSDVMHYIKSSADMCSCGSGKKSGWCCYSLLPNGSKWQHYVFPAMQNLLKLSNHLALLIPQSTDPRDRQDRDLELLQVAVPDRWRELYRNRDSILNYSNPEFCGKWKVLKKLLAFWHANGDKVLVFSYNVKLLKMLQMLFKHTSYNVSYLDGSMSYEDRAKIVDDFNSDPAEFVFLISTRAGGVGLNITSANKVVVVDPNWNPAHDLQAQDRAYRIGQVRDVEVFRLVSAGTIEEIVYARQIYKQQQANIGYTASTERRYFKGVQEKKEHKGEIFGLANLFAFQGDNLVLRDIVNKTNVAESKAGVAVVDHDIDESQRDQDGAAAAGEEENDLVMSQLAAIIAGEDERDEEEEDDARSQDIVRKKANRKSKPPAEPKKSKKQYDPIQAILHTAGVEYTHENSEVVGSSRVEASLSRRALEAGQDLDLGGRHVFANTQERARSKMAPPPRNEEDRTGTDGDDDGVSVSDEEDLDNPTRRKRRVEWKYHPPEEVRRRQLCSMARVYGMDDVVEFALVVEGWTQEERRRWLERFYRGRREVLGVSV
ncbi:MAG: hypothetical protein L6R40_000470 [Gallowayella cf. fulva]|nr:MAG: hypothetical protein L6R40_000470 [Xanthomendoza cf. fulva]